MSVHSTCSQCPPSFYSLHVCLVEHYLVIFHPLLKNCWVFRLTKMPKKYPSLKPRDRSQEMCHHKRVKLHTAALKQELSSKTESLRSITLEHSKLKIQILNLTIWYKMHLKRLFIRTLMSLEGRNETYAIRLRKSTFAKLTLVEEELNKLHQQVSDLKNQASQASFTSFTS